MSYDTEGLLAEDIYFMDDSLGNHYAFYASLSDTSSIPELQIGDSIELYSINVILLSMESDEYYPLLSIGIINVNGIEVAISADVI